MSTNNLPRPDVHTIGFAYASSTIATKVRKAITGCHYVQTRSGLAAFPTYAAALAHAETLGTVPSWDSKDHPDNAQYLPTTDAPVY